MNMEYFRVWSFKTHGILDYGVVATSAAFPKILDIEGTPEATYFYAQGGGETAIAGMSDYNDNSGSRHQLGSANQTLSRKTGCVALIGSNWRRQSDRAFAGLRSQSPLTKTKVIEVTSEESRCHRAGCRIGCRCGIWL
jgi:hypothetical protein